MHRKVCFSAILSVVILSAFPVVAQIPTTTTTYESSTIRTPDAIINTTTATTHYLLVGDAAPPLALGKWIKGQPVTSFEPGKVYVVEFWGTPPAKLAVPAPLPKELPGEYDKNVILIGVDTRGATFADSSNNMGTGSPDMTGAGSTSSFGSNSTSISSMGSTATLSSGSSSMSGGSSMSESNSMTTTAYSEATTYRIAVDQPAPGQPLTRTSSEWIGEVRQSDLPLAYIVDRQGKVVYIGPPEKVNVILPSVVEGSWNPEQQFGNRARQEVAIKLSHNEVDEAMQMLDTLEKQPGEAPWVIPQRFYILAAVRKDPAAATAYAEKMASAPDANPETILAFVDTLLGSGIENPDFNLAGRLLDRAEQLNAGKSPDLAGRITATRFELQLAKGDYAAANSLALTVSADPNATPETLNRIALAITNADNKPQRNLALAEAMASRAVQLTANQNADTIGTLARVNQEQGNFEKAIELQTQAVQIAKPSVRQQFQGTLDEYRSRAGQSTSIMATTTTMMMR